MTGYCWRCGLHGLLSRVTAWCGACTERWNREYAARGEAR